ILGLDFFSVRGELIIPVSPVNSFDASQLLKAFHEWQTIVVTPTMRRGEMIHWCSNGAIRDHREICRG
ncbi:MAG: hypothetical protein J2P36_31590, partial [Ktedonobacteraceae bacterium]|nr:hypothetical protein [Ktedonobacteraceae bacterium]